MSTLTELPNPAELAARSGNHSTGRIAGRTAGRVAAVLGAPYALLNLYWAAGGTRLLAQYGSHVIGRAVPGDNAFRVTSAVLAVLMVTAIVSGLAATSGHRRNAARWVAWLSAGWIALYGGAMTFIGLTVPLALYSNSPGIDADLYRWHTLLWDPWFLVWGLVLYAALARSARRLT